MTKIPVGSQATHDAMRHMSRDSWFRWVCDDPSEIEGGGNFRLVRSRTFLDATPDLIKSAPFPMGLIVRWAPWLIRGQVKRYRLNRFVVGTGWATLTATNADSQSNLSL